MPKLTALTALSPVLATDIGYFVSDPGGTPASKKATVDVLFTSRTITTPTISGAVTWPDNVRQTLNPGATVAGLNVGAVAGDPSTPVNGDVWYDSTNNLMRARINGATVSLAAGAGDALVANPLSQFAATTSLQLKGVISDETGSGALVFASGPSLTSPDLGTSMVTFGGTSSSFPALKRSTTSLLVRLADDSAYTQLIAGTLSAGLASVGQLTADGSNATSPLISAVTTFETAPSTTVRGLEVEITVNGGTLTTFANKLSMGANTGGAVTTISGLDFLALLSSGSASTMRAFRSSIAVASGTTATVAKGIDLSGWSNAGTVTTSYGIYMDSTIDIGSTKYAIYSLSTSLSLLTGSLQAKSIRGTAVTFANVPTPVEGMLVAITDSSTATWGATITGGGANHVLGYYDGTNWKVAG